MAPGAEARGERGEARGGATGRPRRSNRGRAAATAYGGVNRRGFEPFPARPGPSPRRPRAPSRDPVPCGGRSPDSKTRRGYLLRSSSSSPLLLLPLLRPSTPAPSQGITSDWQLPRARPPAQGITPELQEVREDEQEQQEDKEEGSRRSPSCTRYTSRRTRKGQAYYEREFMSKEDHDVKDESEEKKKEVK